LRKPAAIIFDLDGTLVDSAPDIRCALHAVLERNKLPCPELEEVKLMIGGGPAVLVERALDSLGIVAASSEIEHLSVKFQETYLEQGNTLTTLFPGAVDCLEQLADQDIAIGLCSNKPERICHQLLSDLGIRHYFQVIQGSGSGLPTKPDPAVLIETLRRLEAGPERALYVGDSMTDVETARAAGVTVVLVIGGYTAIPAESLGADRVVAGLADVMSTWQ